MVYKKFVAEKLPELAELETFFETDCCGRVEVIARAPIKKPQQHQGLTITELPIHKVSYGTKDPRKPVLILVGGVHGLERIGTQVVKALLSSFNELALWDQQTKKNLNKVRLIFIPLVNPWGMALGRRSNGNGIDLMRNAPIDAMGEVTPFLSGHRLGDFLPWYRGAEGQPMELEALELVRHVSEEIGEAQVAMSVDFHSGFGFNDQLWFPYAKSMEPFPHIANMLAVRTFFDKTFPYHVYKIEPQALNYVTHGDLWDYIYDQHRSVSRSTYLPLCLEMGSWNWVRKNPLQLFTRAGIFDPILPHRRHRAFRRHHLLFDFLKRLMMNSERWARLSRSQRDSYQQKALELWY